MNFSTERTSKEYLALNNCGIQKFFETDSCCLRENGRIDYHILYIAEGICHLWLNGNLTEVPKGSIILFRPGERQQYSFKACDRTISYFIHFTGTGCRHILEKLNIHNIQTAYIGKNLLYEEVFEKMVSEYSLKQYAYEDYCSALLMQLFSIISRYTRLKKRNIGSENETRAALACKKIVENLSNVSPEALAKDCHLSVGRFSHIFKEYTGKSPREYISLMRIDKAKELLLNTNSSIGCIASAVGYPDQNYFSRIFKKTTGVSPKVYRKI